MARYFQISRPDGMSTVKPDFQGQREVQYTVKNVSARSIDGRALLVSLPQRRPPEPADGPVEKGWVKIEGRPERHFDIDKEEIFTVKIAIPPRSPVGNYTFRLDVVSVAKPDEGDQGQTVTFPITEGTSPEPVKWWIPITAAVVLLMVIGVVTWFLIRKVDVPPNLEGHQIKDVKAQLEAKGFKPVLIEAPTIGIPVGQVTNVEPDDKAKKGAEIKVTYAVAPPPIPVPDVQTKRLPLTQATEILDKVNLKYDLTFVMDPNVSENVVVKQDPAAGTKIDPPYSQKIKLTVAAPPAPVEMANLNFERKGYDEAKRALEAAGLKVQEIWNESPSHPDNVHMTVLSQEPHQGQARLGQTVRLTIAAKMVKVPPLRGWNWRQAKTNIEQAGLRLARVTGADCNRVISDSAPVQNTDARKGSDVVLFLEGPSSQNVCYSPARIFGPLVRDHRVFQKVK